MDTAQAIAHLMSITEEPPDDLSLDEFHAIYYAIAFMRSSSEAQIKLADDLLALELTMPRP